MKAWLQVFLALLVTNCCYGNNADSCKGVSTSINKYLYNYGTDFDDIKVTPVYANREYCLNPDYLYDDFSISFSVEVPEDFDSDKFQELDSTWNLVYHKQFGIEIFFQDNSSLKLDSVEVQFVPLNSLKNILSANYTIRNGMLSLFLDKKIQSFIFLNQYKREIGNDEADQFNQSLKCIAGKRTYIHKKIPGT